ncbi:MAG: hypothetical protein F6J97_07990 [Leptolyngbya sp. SIO4C1]|nr:hypothetical protein [Leptolyngbya sp. SIO4C1]
MPSQRFKVTQMLLIGAALATFQGAGCSAGQLTAQSTGRLAKRADPSPQLTQVYPVYGDIVALRIETGQVIYGEQQPYRAEAGDDIETEPKAVWLERDGQRLGTLVGPEQALLYTFDRFLGEPLNRRWVQRSRSYQVTALDQPDQSVILPEAVYYKVKPTDIAQVARGRPQWPLAYTIYLDLPQPLAAGQRYQIGFANSELAPVTFEYAPRQHHSEAVHVSHLGFRPDDPAKVGFLSTWMGTGGGLSYPSGLRFQLVDARDRVVYRGLSELSRAADQPEDARDRNYSGTDVYRLDFSDFQTPGRYRLCVEQVGCSFAFPIGDETWAEAFYVSARGFYHQRSGIELTEPYTDYYQPRSFHPDDGVEVYQSEVTLLETSMGLGDRKTFEALTETRTEERLPQAWGGYFDAGDWDRRAQHLKGTRLLLELVDFFPRYYQQVDLNLPESDNALPDVLDEALWGLDFFRRLQTEAGGIRGGVESARHPRRGEVSWQESLTVMAYAPDPWSSYLYAATAAQAARILKAYDSSLAERYETSALRAMTYAEQAMAELDAAERRALHHEVTDAQNLAALELYRLTADDRWHQRFLATTIFQSAQQTAYRWQHYNQREAAFIYASLSDLPTDATVQRNARRTLLSDADTIVETGQQTSFHWTKALPDLPISTGNSFGRPEAVTLLRAYHLTESEHYLRAAILASQFAAGANPENMVYTTGLGHRSPQHPLIINQRVTNQPPPPGITVYGPLDAQNFEDYWLFSQLGNSVYPDIYEMPTAESYLDIFMYPAVAEFTIQDTIAHTAYTWGYLAARPPL